MLRTNAEAERLDSEQTALAYQRLAKVERAFRSLKSVDLKVRPIHHRLAERVRAHVLIAMLAYYVEWHMRQALAPLLFDDELGGGEGRSERAKAKASRKRTAAGLPVQSFQDWLKDLATIVKNTIEPVAAGLEPFEMITRPTPTQQAALELLGVKL